MRKLILAAVLTAMTGTGGTAWARGDIEILARTCNACHGVGGVSAGTTMPSIGGLPRDYLERVMKQWKYGERDGITMNRVVRGLSDDEIDALAAYFAAQPWVPSPQPAEDAVLTAGGKVVYEVCTDCHGLDGGDPDWDAPRLNGQWSKYLQLELEKYRSAEYLLPHRKMGKAVGEVEPTKASAAAVYFGAQGKGEAR